MINAIKNRIFLKKDKQPEKIGLIYVPKIEGQYAPPYSGTIISIGLSITDSDYETGTRVLFHDLAGSTFEIDGEEIFSIRESDVLCILTNNNIKID